MPKSAAVLSLVILGVALGLVMAAIAPEPGAAQAIEWLENPRSVVGFNLETEAGEFDNRSLAGRWTIVLFGFLHCPDVCPTSLSQLVTLADSLAGADIDEDVAFVFVSVDPGRDSVADIGRYVRHFDPSILGVTGKQNQLASFASSLGIQFRVSADADEYTVAHSVSYSVIDPDGFLRGRFQPGFDVTTLVRQFTAHLR